MKRRKIWFCKVGENVVDDTLPPGADWPMRKAVSDAYEAIVGHAPDFVFSGWNEELTPGELRVLQDAPQVIDPKLAPVTAAAPDNEGAPVDARRRLIMRLRAGFPTEFLESHPDLIDLLIETVNTLTADAGAQAEVAKLRTQKDLLAGQLQASAHVDRDALWALGDRGRALTILNGAEGNYRSVEEAAVAAKHRLDAADSLLEECLSLATRWITSPKDDARSITIEVLERIRAYFAHHEKPAEAQSVDVKACGCGGRHVEGRACKPSLKRAFIERLLKAWEKYPTERFGQFLTNAAQDQDPLTGAFYTEDDKLLTMIERR